MVFYSDLPIKKGDFRWFFVCLPGQVTPKTDLRRSTPEVPAAVAAPAKVVGWSLVLLWEAVLPTDQQGIITDGIMIISFHHSNFVGFSEKIWDLS